jgi:hypothetical protein
MVKRHTTTNDADKGEFVVLAKEIYEDLKTGEYITKKNGKGLFLL